MDIGDDFDSKRISTKREVHASDSPEERLKKLQQLRKNMVELVREKQVYQNELDKLENARSLYNQARASDGGVGTHYKYIGAGYYIVTEEDEFRTSLEEDISSISDRIERTEKVIKILEEEFNEIVETLEDDVDDAGGELEI